MDLYGDEIVHASSHDSAGNGKIDGEAAEAIATILSLAQQIRELLNKRLAARAPNNVGFNDVRLSVLKMIGASTAEEGCSQTELARELGQSESSVSTLIDRMRADRLLYRLRSKSDRRRSQLMLTDLGRMLLEQSARDYAEFVAELLQSLSGNERRALLALLNQLESTLTERRSEDRETGTPDSTAA